jgi:hypothetical protein
VPDLIRYWLHGKPRGSASSNVNEVEARAFQDAQRAWRLVRGGGKDWDVNPKKLGIMNFSVGGDLVFYSFTKST